jgi:hypothetical protein
LAKKNREEKPKEYTRRQLSQHKKQERRQRIIVITGIAVIAAIILIPIFGWFTTEYIPLHQTMLKINGKSFNVAYYLDFIKIARINDPQSDVGTLSNNALNILEVGRDDDARH